MKQYQKQKNTINNIEQTKLIKTKTNINKNKKKKQKYTKQK